jgi:hypothetical protein
MSLPCALYKFQQQYLIILIEQDATVFGEDLNPMPMKPLVAWKKCSKPKNKGGLGIINLKTQNKALLLKHLDKFYNKKDIPWVKLI